MPKIENNIQVTQAERDFQGLWRELRVGVTPERKAEIRAEAVTCEDLMNYSPSTCNFDRLRPLVGEVLRLTT